MNILHTVATLEPASGGPARSVPQLALALAAKGHRVGLWSPNAVEHLSDLSPEQESGLFVFSGDIANVLKRFGTPDLIHDHGIWLNCHREVAGLCSAQGIPRVVSPRGMLEPWALNHKKWKKKLAWWLYQRRDLHAATALHATADSEAAQLRKLGFKQGIIVAPNGVAEVNAEKLKTETLTEDKAASSNAATSHRSLITDHSLPILGSQRFSVSAFPPKTALFLSRIHPKKGLPMLLETWAKLRPVGWRLRIVGPDEEGHLSQLQNQCTTLGLDWAEELANEAQITQHHPITFSGPREGGAKWRAMQEADLFILPSYSENFGIAVAEALACGVPVITTTGTPWHDLPARGCGWWVEPNAEALGMAIEKATTMPAPALAAMGAHGIAWMQSDFSWNGIARSMTEAYEEILNR